MLRQSGFERALLLSFMVHLLWMAVVTVVVLPGKYRISRSPEMTFLGPILDEVSFPEVRGKQYSRVPLSGRIPRLLFRQIVQPRFFPEESVFPEAEDIPDKPQFPPRHKKPEFGRARPLKEQDGFTGSEIPVNGDGRLYGIDRGVQYQPPIPEYSHWMEEDAVLKVGLSFCVDPEGRVKTVEITRTSGYPEIDLLAKRHLKSWLFSPVDPGGERRDEWGTTLMSLRVKGSRSGSGHGD